MSHIARSAEQEGVANRKQDQDPDRHRHLDPFALPELIDSSRLLKARLWKPLKLMRISSVISSIMAVLKTVSIHRSNADALLEIFAGCPRLEELALGYVRLRIENLVQAFEICWSRLRKFSVDGIWIYPAYEIDPGEVAVMNIPSRLPGRECTGAGGGRGSAMENRVKIQDLTFSGIGGLVLGAQMDVIKRCRDLRRLKWCSRNGSYDRGPLHLLAEDLRRSQSTFSRCSLDEGDKAEKRGGLWFQKLTSLLSPHSPLLVEDFVTVISSSLGRGLAELDLSGTKFNLDCWKALQGEERHLNALRVLRLENCHQLPGLAVHEILCSMPSLEVLMAHRISDRDILENDDGPDRPWVCARLRVLKVSVDLLLDSIPSEPSSEPSPQLSCLPSQVKILKRLSSLVQLEECDLSDDFFLFPDCQRLRLTLDQGLEQLQSLRRLRRWACPTYPYLEWGPAEAQWVRMFWPSLEKLVGYKLQSEETEELLKGIKVMECDAD
ncbi:hypothetical protein BGZ83_008784 [Gryganskiella cystojenkinii]|nr:hypothetical protein BGZ83_008784 [Gryganskiella cystojenkinii]